MTRAYRWIPEADWVEPVELEVSKEFDPIMDPLGLCLSGDDDEAWERMGACVSMRFDGSIADLMRISTALALWATGRRLGAQQASEIQSAHGTIESIDDEAES